MSSPKQDKAERQKCRKLLISELKADIKKSGVEIEEFEQQIVNSCSSELEGALLELFYIEKKTW